MNNITKKLRNSFRALALEIKLEILSSFRYRFALISDIVVFSVLMIFFLTSNTGESLTDKYNYGNYKELLIMGYVAWTISVAALTSSINSISEELGRGTFYRKLHSNCYLSVLLLGELIASLVVEVAVIAILLLMSYFIWHIEMHVTLIGIISILINTLGMFGIGLIVGGLTIRLKRVGALTFIIQMGLLFITDTIPTSSTVLLISRCIPLTLCNDVLRTSISGGDVLMPFLELICVSLLWVVIGNVLFKLCIGRAKKKGNLLFY